MFRALLWSVSMFAAIAGPVCAENYPERTIQMLVSLPAGTTPDILGRGLAQGFDDQLGQRVVVENRDGGGQVIAMNVASSAAADGYTLVLTPVAPVTIQLHRMKLPYTDKTFVPVCQTFENVFFLAVSPSSPYQDLKSFMTYAKSHPGKLRYGHSGLASSPHLMGAQLWQQAGLQVTDVPYRGESGYVVNLLAGELDAGIASTSLVTSHKLRPLVVFSDKRSANFPDVPTAAEMGFDVSASGYGGLFARAEISTAVLRKLEQTCKAVVNSKRYQALADKLYQESTYLDSAEFSARIAQDSRIKAGLLKTLGLSREN